MFDRPESLLDDIDHLAETQTFPSAGFALSSSEVGQSVIMLALGRMPSVYMGLVADDKVSDLRQQTARQLVARWFLASEATLYASLGVAPDCSHEMLRENYRRLIGLVHPDTRPVGFPEDSASRVNMAYSVLADAERRASYDASMALLTQQTPSPLQQTITKVPNRARTSQHEGILDRFRAAVPQVQFGKGLLAIAGFMLVPIGFAVYSLANRDVHPQIVEARAKLNVSPDFASRPESSNSTGQAASASIASASGNSPVAANAVSGPSDTTGLVSKRQPTTTIETPPKLTLSTRLQNLLGGNVQVPSTSVEAPSRIQSVQNNPASLAPVPASTVNSATSQPETIVATRAASVSPTPVAATTSAVERTAAKSIPNSDNPGATATADRPSRASNAASPLVPASLPQGNAAPAPTPENRVNPVDADDVLVRLSGAYEAGSIAAFSKVFSTSMAGRRQLLSDYERVFQQTRQRSIRFTQFKHKVSGEKLLTSGFAVVSTVDNDNRASSQRIFLEIDIGREPEGLKIERLHNYPLN